DRSDIRSCTTTRPPRRRTRLPAPEFGRLRAAAWAELDADVTGSRDSASSRHDSRPPLVAAWLMAETGANAVVDAVNGARCSAPRAAGTLAARPAPTNSTQTPNTPALRLAIHFEKKSTPGTCPTRSAQQRQPIYAAACSDGSLRARTAHTVVDLATVRVSAGL